jgi:hypothetical protein
MESGEVGDPLEWLCDEANELHARSTQLYDLTRQVTSQFARSVNELTCDLQAGFVSEGILVQPPPLRPEEDPIARFTELERAVGRVRAINPDALQLKPGIDKLFRQASEGLLALRGWSDPASRLSAIGARLLGELARALAEIERPDPREALSGPFDVAIQEFRKECDALLRDLENTRKTWPELVKSIRAQCEELTELLSHELKRTAGPIASVIEGPKPALGAAAPQQEVAPIKDIRGVRESLETVPGIQSVLDELAAHVPRTVARVPAGMWGNQFDRDLTDRETKNGRQRDDNAQAKASLAAAREELQKKTDATFARIVAQHESDVKLLVEAYESQLEKRT